jgi:probable phosphoglycerate mutase
MHNREENIIIVSHGDLLSTFNTMFLGLEVEVMNKTELFGLDGGVSLMYAYDDGIGMIKKISDMSYIK